MILRVLLVLTLTRGTLCQEIKLSSPVLISPCTSKSRGGQDLFFFNGTVGKDVPSLTAQGWSNLIRIDLYLVNRRVDSINYCTLAFDGDSCEAQSSYGCSCVYQVKQIHFVVNYTLGSYSSMGTFHVHWSLNPGRHYDVTTVQSAKNYSLPEICDVRTAHLTLTIEGGVTSLPTTTFCLFTMTLGTSNLIQLCCFDMAQPCYTQISFQGNVVATNEAPCVIYRPTVDGATGFMQLSYSVCTQTDYLIGSNCTIQTGVVTTIVTTPTTVVATTANADGVDTPEFIETTSGVEIPVTKKTAEPSPPEKSNTFQIVLWVALLLILLVIIGALVALYIIRKRSRQEDISPSPSLPNSHKGPGVLFLNQAIEKHPKIEIEPVDDLHIDPHIAELLSFINSFNDSATCYSSVLVTYKKVKKSCSTQGRKDDQVVCKGT